MAKVKKSGPWNPQKASAYVGKGVLKKGGTVTPVPNGPLVKKKGPFKGSSLKKGGVVKAQTGISKSKTVHRSPDNMYKTVIKSKTGPGVEKTTIKETRTLKGFLKGAPSIPKVIQKRRESAP